MVENATVGGTIASGLDSPLRHFYGTARDFVLGAEFVDGTGALAKSGGRVVKNVTGYDFHKLLNGTLGSLAVITRINFRTFPLHAVDSRAGRGALAGIFQDVSCGEISGRVAASGLASLDRVRGLRRQQRSLRTLWPRPDAVGS